MLDLTSPDTDIMQHTRVVLTRYGPRHVLAQDELIRGSIFQ